MQAYPANPENSPKGIKGISAAWKYIRSVALSVAGLLWSLPAQAVEGYGIFDGPTAQAAQFCNFTRTTIAGKSWILLATHCSSETSPKDIMFIPESDFRGSWLSRVGLPSQFTKLAVSPPRILSPEQISGKKVIISWKMRARGSGEISVRYEDFVIEGTAHYEPETDLYKVKVDPTVLERAHAFKSGKSNIWTGISGTMVSFSGPTKQFIGITLQSTKWGDTLFFRDLRAVSALARQVQGN